MNHTTSGARTSYSRIAAWLRCPRKYRFKYVDDAQEEHTPLPLLFGTAIHEGCEAWLSALRDGRQPDRVAVFDAFQRALTDGIELADRMGCPVAWAGSSCADWVARGEAMLAAFLSGIEPGLRVLATEKAFSLELSPGLTVDGVIDLILDDGNGRLRVVDIKTAAARYSPERLCQDLQPTVYMAAAELLFDAAGRVDFEYWLLLKTRVPRLEIQPAIRDARDRAELIETIDEVERAKAHGLFPRIRGPLCHGCEYAQRCAGRCP